MATMRGPSFTIGQIVVLVSSRLASARAERIVAGEVVIVVRFTEAGRRVLAPAI
jgi:hypothetical protein